MKFHRLSKYFPMLEGEEFELLKQDIKNNGQLEPIIRYQGEILDGVNRYRACQELGIEPKYDTYEGSDPLGYVISLNIRRRHLDTSQRAMLATEMLPEFEAEARERKLAGATRSSEDDQLVIDHQGRARSSFQAARVFGVSGPSVQRAKRVKQEAPEKVDEIIKGKTTVGAVDAEIRQKKVAEAFEERDREREAKERQKNPREVAEYLEEVKQFSKSIQKAIKVADYGKFSPEAARFVLNKHRQLRDWLDALDDELREIK